MTPPDLSAFGAVSVLGPLPGGHRAPVWRVARAGAVLVAKGTTRSEAALRWLTPVQEAARAAGFTVPALVPAADGRLAPRGITLEPFVEGRAGQPADLPALAARLAAFHRAAQDIAQRPGFASTRDLLTREGGGDVDLGALPPALVARLRAAWAALPGDEAAIHGDLHPGNLIWADTGPALIDWDEARRDRPAFDLIGSAPADPVLARAHLAWEIAACWQREPARAQGLAARF